MKTLSREAQAQARAFIYAHARPLEQAIFACEFEGGTADLVLQELAGFQNADGGFGRALESDLRLPDSSVLATTVGLQMLRRLDVDAEHPLVRGAMDYLMATYDVDDEVWPIIPAAANEAPHAPWWSLDEGFNERFGGFLANPRAEIVGYLYDYAELVPAALRDHFTRAVVQHLRTRGDELTGEDIPCYVRLIETPGLPGGVRFELLRLMTPVLDRAVVKDPARWGRYGLAPLDVVEGPNTPFAALLADVVAAHLDYEITQHSKDGVWEPRWDWGGLYPEAWEQAKRDWSGVLTVRMLTTLGRFGRLEGREPAV